ncbi:MAG TPA: response regulator [Bryobacteraceae bacterium]
MTETPVELLLVEDNLSDVELTLRIFKKHNLTNRIKVAGDGAEALEFFFGPDGQGSEHLIFPPRMILLDLKLPKLNGIEVLERMKADPRTRLIPVVILTSSREDQDLHMCYELGVNSYIVKPVDFEQFTEAIRQLGLYWLLLNERPHGTHKSEA